MEAEGGLPENAPIPFSKSVPVCPSMFTAKSGFLRNVVNLVIVCQLEVESKWGSGVGVGGGIIWQHASIC